MKKELFIILFLFGLVNIYSQTIINTASINKYANVVDMDYCKNQVSVPAGMGGQFVIGDKVLIIQMKGATLNDDNNANNGQVVDYNNAGNYEINEIKTINSTATDDIVFKYEIERPYNVSGAVQIVNIPQYDDVIIQNTLTCLAWDGSIGGILTFNASGNVTMNANIDVSEKGFRGGIAEDITGTTCFNNAGTNDSYNCAYVGECGALKGEGIGNRYETKELGRAPNANGGGGGNDHNAGGAGGGAFTIGGKGGNRSLGFCEGKGAFGGSNLDYDNLFNKIFFTGGGGAGDAGNANGATGATSGGRAGGMVFITANSIKSNVNKIISNGEDITAIADGDGAGGGGAGGLVVLDVNNYSDNLEIELNGGFGGNASVGTSCEGPGGGGAGGIVWLKQSSLVSNINLIANGGNPGTIILGACLGSSNDAENGGIGGYYFDFKTHIDNEIFEKLTLIAGSDTVVCGDGGARLWANANASHDFDFEWTWSTGTETEYNFLFKPEFGGYYDVLAEAYFFNVVGEKCVEPYHVFVDIRKPTISIVASSFDGDTIRIGEAYFINAIINPLNPNYTYSWTPAERVEPNNDRNAIATPYETGEFCLTVTDELDCANTECIDLYVFEPKIEMPNAFSPNDDNLNNTLFPILTEDVNISSFRVYDRWGDLVFETSENTAWDGKKNGVALPQDLYFWHIKVEQILSGRTFERMGEVTIVR